MIVYLFEYLKDVTDDVVVNRYANGSNVNFCLLDIKFPQPSVRLFVRLAVFDVLEP